MQLLEICVIIKVLLWINISLFILHEMDAVKTREWKMMILINKMNDNIAHVVFTSLHFVLFMTLFILTEFYFYNVFISVSILLIMHQFMHLLFIKHSENRMNNLFSKVIIFLMFLNSIFSLIYYFILVKKSF